MKEHFETKILDGILSGRVHIIPGGVEKAAEHIRQDEARRILDLPLHKTIFLHFGAVHTGKDIDTVISGFRGIPDGLLVQAGKAVPGVDLSHSVELLGLQDRVVVRDEYVPEAEKQMYFAAADAIVLSYRRDFWQAASMLWQAARFNLPVIASDVGDLGELTRKYGLGFVFRAGSEDSLVKAISDFMCLNSIERGALARNCDNFCDDFSVESWAQRCINILIDLTVEKR
jgi:glycosyltransferase involved in cell wall biosynthesis